MCDPLQVATEVIIKSDQEPAVTALIDDIKHLRPGVRINTEMTPVGASQSNGVVECGIQSMQGLLSTMKSALEARWSTTIPDGQPILA